MFFLLSLSSALFPEDSERADTDATQRAETDCSLAFSHYSLPTVILLETRPGRYGPNHNL
jgi:hypothetical protein